ncbi:MAG TPA: M23 family metallopeptidase [Anaerolineae bacterium]|nr:M23 family metallopeptidase [Anaerolineae bacterium]
MNQRLINLIILLITLTACQAESAPLAAVSANQPSTSTGPACTNCDPATNRPPTTPLVPTPTLVPTIPPLLPPPNTQSQFIPPALPTALPTTTRLWPTMTPTSSPTPLASPTATATPLPTFTPPALPFTQSFDHYWLVRPIPQGGVVWTDKTYPYGSTRSGTLRPHHGVEFNVPRNTPILAAASGTVVVAGPDDTVVYGETTNFYGQLVVIQHESQYEGQNVYSLYGHLDEVHVTEGQYVNAHDLLGLSGSTGVADGAHLHFEVRLGRNSYDATRNPLLWIYPFSDRGTIAGRITWPDGSFVHEAPVEARRVDANSRYAATTTYAQGNVNPDDYWDENFALDDIEAGYYEVIVRDGEDKYTAEVWVYPYQTSFVEITIEP